MCVFTHTNGYALASAAEDCADPFQVTVWYSGEDEAVCDTASAYTIGVANEVCVGEQAKQHKVHAVHDVEQQRVAAASSFGHSLDRYY